MQDVMWVGLVVAFYLFSGWFVGFSDRLIPAVRRPREAGPDGSIPGEEEGPVAP